MSEFIKIQQELKAPKNQYNNFGRYPYRSCEDILEAVKPLLVKYECLLYLEDEVVAIGDRFYVKATVTIQKDDASISVSAYAREQDSKKGMDAAQLTGATSSYARKYALNGLFLIDDTKDSDSGNNNKPEMKPFDASASLPAKKAYSPQPTAKNKPSGPVSNDDQVMDRPLPDLPF